MVSGGWSDPVALVRIRCTRQTVERAAPDPGQSVRSERLMASSGPMGPVKVSPVGTKLARR